MQDENPTNENRSHKDSLFVDYFSKDWKQHFLSLYNALHETSLQVADTQLERVCFEKNLLPGGLGGRRGFAGAQPRLAKVAAPLATFRPKGRRSLPKRCWGSRSKHVVRSFQRRGGFRRDKRRDIAASCPLTSRGGVPS